jgi:hypothetical protein
MEEDISAKRVDGRIFLPSRYFVAETALYELFMVCTGLFLRSGGKYE